jgi:hypothetical protein
VKHLVFSAEEISFLINALNFYCDETTHQSNGDVGLNPNSRESKVLNQVRNKLSGRCGGEL